MNGNYFLLPNRIFDEGLTPMEFVVYSFLTSKDDAKGKSFYSVPNIAKYCGMCENSCRKAIRGLTEKGYIDVSERYFAHSRQSNLYTVHKIWTISGSANADKQLKAILTRKEKEHESNQGKTKNALCGVCGGENKHMKEITKSNLCVVVSVVNTLL